MPGAELPNPIQTPLPVEIHAATRAYHTSLNRLIVSRLPLCLPPHATSPAVYVVGIAAFGQIFTTFEREWDAVIESSGTAVPLRTLLQHIRLTSLSRCTRLQSDLSVLRWRLAQADPHGSSTNTKLAAATDHIGEVIQQKPHVILAYAWVMYMALFNGGRWIRDQLRSSGDEFWGLEASTDQDTAQAIDCLSFWDFEGDRDGEDVKEEFKARYEDVAAQMSREQRQDIVEEAVNIFKTCSQLVGLLDEQVPPPPEALPPPVPLPGGQSWISSGYANASSTIHSMWLSLSQSAPLLSLSPVNRNNDRS